MTVWHVVALVLAVWLVVALFLFAVAGFGVLADRRAQARWLAAEKRARERR